jgi:hypothetical protein
MSHLLVRAVAKLSNVRKAGNRMGDHKIIILSSFGRHVMPLSPAAFTVVSNHRSALGPRVGGMFLYIRKACTSVRTFNNLMIMKTL